MIATHAEHFANFHVLPTDRAVVGAGQNGLGPGAVTGGAIGGAISDGG